MAHTRKNLVIKRKTLRRAKKRQTGGVQKPIVLDGKSYQGADIFIINKYTDGQFYVILLEQINADTGKHYFQLPGGRCEDTHKTLEDTINQELWEESKKSVSISKRIFKMLTEKGSFVDYEGDSRHGNPGMRRCFVCYVPHVSITLYNENSTILNNLTSVDNNKARGKSPGHHEKLLHAFLETYSMKRILLSSLKKSYDDTVAKLSKDDGRSRMIDDVWVNSFVMKAFILALKNGLFKSPFPLQGQHITYEQKPNGNKYKKDKINIEGKCDYYN